MKQLRTGEAKMIIFNVSSLPNCPFSASLTGTDSWSENHCIFCNPLLSKIIPHLKCSLPLRTHSTRTGCSTNWHAGCLCQMFTHLLTEIQRLLPISSSCSGCSYSRVSKNRTLDTFLLELEVKPNCFGNMIFLGCVLFPVTRSDEIF